MSENDVKILQDEENTEILNTENSSILDPENISKDNKTEKGIESGNIFDDFNVDSSLVDEVKKQEEKEKRDLYYYLSLFGKIFLYLFIAIIIACAVVWAYIYIQKSDTITDSPYLDLFCFVLNNENVSIPDGTTYCSSASYTKKFYEEKFSTLKEEQKKGILKNLVAIYEKENFLRSKEVAFLLDKSEDRLQIIDVLEEFESLKKNFLGINKSRIQCRNIIINSVEKILEVTCDAYSQGYENNGIVGFSGEVGNRSEYISGTSLSLANSFLNYIEKIGGKFTLIDRQKLFEIGPVDGNSEIGMATGYTKRTTFNMKLKINF